MELRAVTAPVEASTEGESRNHRPTVVHIIGERDDESVVRRVRGNMERISRDALGVQRRHEMHGLRHFRNCGIRNIREDEDPVSPEVRRDGLCRTLSQPFN